MPPYELFITVLTYTSLQTLIVFFSSMVVFASLININMVEQDSFKVNRSSVQALRLLFDRQFVWRHVSLVVTLCKN